MRVALVSQTGVGTSVPLVPDAYTVGDGMSVQLVPGAGATCTVQGTLDDVFGSGPIVWVDLPIAALIGATANQLQFIQHPVRALRLNQTVGASLSTLEVMQRGIR
jgi:hypothetical protein